MEVLCPRCNTPLDATRFAFERRVRCACGAQVDVGLLRSTPHHASPAAAELKRRGDALTWTILYSDLPRVDVDIAIANLREWVHGSLPDRVELFEMVWVARWDRLRAQGWDRHTTDP